MSRPYPHRLPGPRLQVTQQRTRLSTQGPLSLLQLLQKMQQLQEQQHTRLSTQGPLWWQQQAAREWPDVTADERHHDWPTLVAWLALVPVVCLLALLWGAL